MQIELIPIADLRPAPYNPRVALKPGDAAFERLQRSLEEFDLVQPLVWNRRTGHVVGGHQRLEILKRRGVSEVECVVVDLPAEREKALNVALNNSRVAGDWEPQKLLDLVDELQSLPDFDATLTGFSEQELCDLVLRPADDFAADAGSGAESEEAADLVTATLEVPRPRWEAVRVHLDALLADEPEVALHIAVSSPLAPRLEGVGFRMQAREDNVERTITRLAERVAYSQRTARDDGSPTGIDQL